MITINRLKFKPKMYAKEIAAIKIRANGVYLWSFPWWQSNMFGRGLMWLMLPLFIVSLTAFIYPEKTW